MARNTREWRGCAKYSKYGDVYDKQFSVKILFSNLILVEFSNLHKNPRSVQSVWRSIQFEDYQTQSNRRNPTVAGKIELVPLSFYRSKRAGESLANIGSVAWEQCASDYSSPWIRINRAGNEFRVTSQPMVPVSLPVSRTLLPFHRSDQPEKRSRCETTTDFGVAELKKKKKKKKRKRKKNQSTFKSNEVTLDVE